MNKKQRLKLEEILITLDDKLIKLEVLFNNVRENKSKLMLMNIIKDIINLTKELIPDVVMYDYVMENYNDPLLYQGHYYIYYSISKINMIFERVANFLGIVYETEFDEDIEKNGIKDVLKKLDKDDKTKKANEFKQNAVLKKYVKIILESEQLRCLIELRKYNEHDLSAHLNDEIAIKEVKVNKNIYLNNTLEFVQSCNYNTNCFEIYRLYKVEKEKQELMHNYNVNKSFKNKIIPNIMWILEKLVVLCEECINVYKEIVIPETKIYIRHKELYIWSLNEIEKERCFSGKYKINGIELNRILAESKNLKEKARERSLKISNNPKLISENLIVKKLEEYFVDATFRLTESIRSLIDMICVLNSGEYEFFELIDADYFYYATILKMYSCYEKAGKIIYEFHEYTNNIKKIKFTDKQFKKIRNITMDSDNIFYEALNIAKKIVEKDEYEMYQQVRDKTYHGIREKYVLTEEQLAIQFSNNVYIFFVNMKDLLQILQIINEALNDFYEGLCQGN